MYNELFNLDALPPEKLTEALTDPLAYLKKRLYPRTRQESMQFGFKLFYDHLTPEYFNKMIAPGATAEDLQKRISNLNRHIEDHYSMDLLKEKFKQTREYLINDPSLRVIHLKRENKLETLISLKTAYLTNKWMRWKPEEGSMTCLHLTYEECCHYFTKIEGYEKAFTDIFRDQKRIDITYEELARDKQEVADRVFDFLAVSRKPVNTILQKQIRHCSREIVTNYDELKNAFSSSVWSGYFES